MTSPLRAAALVAVVVLAGCGDDSDPAVTEPGSTTTTATGDTTTTAAAAETTATTVGPAPPTAPTVSVVAEGLEAPWGLAFLPDGDALVSERDSGRLLRVTPAGEVTEIQTLPAEGENEGGLLGIAVSPTFATDGLVFAHYTTAADNRVVRFTLGGEPEPILTGLPSAGIHNGGRLAFGPDGFLYVGTGDAGEPGNAQDPDSLGGKILRITPGGDPAPGNPSGTAVYSLGHRNVQGLAFDAAGSLLAGEFGQSTFDELNRIEAGANHGWPEVEGEGGVLAGFTDPIVTWTPEEASPSGIAVLVGGAIPAWEGDVFLAALRGERLWRVDLDDSGAVVGREALLEGEYGRLRAVAQAPDGSLWVMTSNRDGRGDPAEADDRILRIGP
jgi:glucose/arabinose dehydrogenase